MRGTIFAAVAAATLGLGSALVVAADLNAPPQAPAPVPPKT
jgi:hypothetical protein